jgi:hypothetical protein
MKTNVSIAIFFISISMVFSQNKEIDSTNYCDFYNMNAHYNNSSIKTKHLSESIITDIIYSEMKKMGFKSVNQFQIVKIDSQKYVSSICYSEKSKFGFLLEGIIETVPLQKNRYVVSLNKEHSGLDYREKIVTLNGNTEFTDFKEIPKNFYIIKIDNYWYQESNNQIEDKKLVSKEFIINLLKNDIRKVLNKVK